MKQMRIGAVAMAVCLMIGCAAGCGKTEPSSTDTPSAKEAYADRDYGFQLEKPALGDTVAILHTSMGDISMRFFPEGAPKAVENFLTHAKNGYYNGITFHRVMDDFMIQGGDPTATGSGGESIWGADFEDEFSPKLMNLRYSVSMANSGVNTNGSQFFINQKKASAGPVEMKTQYTAMYEQYSDLYEQYKTQYPNFTTNYPTLGDMLQAATGSSMIPSKIPDAVWELYAKEGGNISLDGAWRYQGGHTVFGQVYEGTDVVDAIAAVSVDSNNKPVKDVVINSIEVTTYTIK